MNFFSFKTTYVGSQLSCDQKKIVGLDHCNIRHAGKYGDIKQMCPLIEELDLSSNLLTDWNDVFNKFSWFTVLVYWFINLLFVYSMH